jgi:hypothetical protein
MKSIIFFLFAIVLLGSCAHERSAAYAYDSGGGRLASNSDKFFEESKTDKKVIYNSTVYLTVKEPDTASVKINEIAKTYKGYVQQSGTSYCVIRVEQKLMEKAIIDISALGTVTEKQISGEDVTSQYLDYGIRLENAEKSRMRYLELLAKAENVQAALLVEKELERLNETIEMLKGQMNQIDHLSQYSTITIYLKEKKKPGIIGYIGVGLYKAVKWLFVRN